MEDWSETQLGCLGLTVIAVICGFWWFSSSDSESPRPPDNRPERGDIVKPDARYPRVCMNSEDGLSEILNWIGKDNQEAVLVMMKYGGQIVELNDDLKVLDPVVLWGKARVRVLSTNRECYVVAELIGRK